MGLDWASLKGREGQIGGTEIAAWVWSLWTGLAEGRLVIIPSGSTAGLMDVGPVWVGVGVCGGVEGGGAKATCTPVWYSCTAAGRTSAHCTLRSVSMALRT